MATPVVTEVSICSDALSELGDDPIQNLTDNSERARLCNRHYFRVRDEVLKEKNWKFATTRQKLTLDATAPISGFSSQFILPGDFLHLQSTDLPESEADNWRIEGNRILTDSSSLTITYTKRVEDPTLFDPLFARTVTMKLAWRIAKAITGQQAIEDRMKAAYLEAKREGGTRDAQQNAPQQFEVPVLVDVRLS